jgi:hypothetical protein
MRSVATRLPERVAVQVRRAAAELEIEADTLESGRDRAGRRVQSQPRPERPTLG